MAEKGIKRTSFDLQVENSNHLKEFAQRKNTNLSRVMNNTIQTIFGLDPKVKKAISDFCEKQLELAGEDLINATEFEKQDILRIIAQYQGLNYLFKDSNSRGEMANEPKMKKIYLKKGYVLIPNRDDWIILDNFAKSEDCMYAGVVETKTPQDMKVNHFVFFCNYKYGADYPAGFEDEILAACSQKDPSFKKIVDSQPMIGNDRYISSDFPIPRLFHIVEFMDPMYWNDFNPNYEPPYGAVIMRE